jgi:hypothetical protein
MVLKDDGGEIYNVDYRQLEVLDGEFHVDDFYFNNALALVIGPHGQ